MGLKRLPRPGESTVFLLIALLSSLIVISLYIYRPRFLVYMDLKAMDAMAAARPRRTPSDVVIVAVDEKSVNDLGRWPWTRKVTASLLERLKPAKTVAVDMVFSEGEARGADEALSKAVSGGGNVVLGYFFRDDTVAEPVAEALAQIGRSRIGLVRYSGPVDKAPLIPAPEFISVETNIALIGTGAAGSGTFNIIPDDDAIHRAVNLVYVFRGSLYPNLALEAVRHFRSGSITLDAAEYGIDSLRVDGLRIPVDETGALMLNFYGPGRTFKTYPAVDVIKGRVGPGAFSDKLVFIGVTEKGIYDIRPTPVDRSFPGVELLATAAGNAVEGRFLIRDTRVVILDYAMISVLPLLLSFLVSRVRRTYLSLVILAALSTFAVLFDFHLFSSQGLRAGPLYPALSLALAYLGCEAYRNIVVEKKSRYLRKAFSTYVSTQLVNEIIKDPDRLKLGGEKRVITVLFSDIRGFTTLSEKLDPEGLVALLNEYLSPMTRIVLQEEGMLDKYIGDAIMAVFNAPLVIPDHARRACRAALAMKSRLRGLNDGWAEKGWPRIEIGVGINTGEAVVGNMGADLRFDYTAIGDTVNLASRLEGINKLYGTSVMVSEHTYREVRDEFLLREIDLVRVKGKETPSAIYELMGAKGDEAGELADRFSGALRLYRQRCFHEALSLFEAISRDFPGDGPSRVYIERCAQYLASPPFEGWDGVFVAKTK